MGYKFNPFTGNLDEVGAGGGAATPGGADTQVQFNDGGSFGGDSGLTYNDTAGALTVGGKTVTTDAPVINLSQTWDNAATTFTGFKLNVTDTASAAGTNLLDLQVGGASRFKVATNDPSAGGSAGQPAVIVNGLVDIKKYYGSAFILNNASASNGIKIGQNTNGFLDISSSGDNGVGFYLKNGLARLTTDATNIFAQRNGTNAQTYRLYNTYTDASNYERGFFQWSSNVLEIGTEGAGTGSEKPVRITAATLKLPNLPTYADNAAATSGGLAGGDVYKTATGELRITV
jgi:hypothetical protein